MAQQANYKTAQGLADYRLRQKNTSGGSDSSAPITLPPQEGLGALASRLKEKAPLTARQHPRGILAKAPSLKGLAHASKHWNE